MSGQIDACDPQRTLAADDFYHVLTEVSDRVMSVLVRDARAELDDEDRAFITQRVRWMVRPGPGASEAMVVADGRGKLAPEGAKPIEFDRGQRVVCRLGGKDKWAAGGVVQQHAAATDDDGGGLTKPCYVHVMMDPPHCRLIAVPAADVHLQRAAACERVSRVRSRLAREVSSPGAARHADAALSLYTHAVPARRRPGCCGCV